MNLGRFRKICKSIPLSEGRLEFIDSFQFIPQGLDKFAKTFEDDEFRYLSESCTTCSS